MSEFSAWGAESSGSRLAELDQSKLEHEAALTKLNLEQAASQPVMRRFHEAQAGKLEEELAQDRRFAALQQARLASAGSQPSAPAPAYGSPGFQPTRPPSMADRLGEMASDYAAAGSVVKATALAKGAAYITGKEIQGNLNQARQQQEQLKTTRERAELVGQLLADVNDEASWKQATALYAFQTGEPSQYADLPYDPALVKRLRDNALSVKERADISARQGEYDSRERNRRSAISLRLIQEDVAEARIDLMEAREDVLRKNGGGGNRPVGSPSIDETKKANQLILKEFPGMEGSLEAAYSIAAEARRLRKANPALDAYTAMQQAFLAAKQAGDFQEANRNISVGSMNISIPGTSKTTFTGAGKTPQTAITIPSNKEALMKDRYYVAPNGQVGKWNGRAMIVGAPSTGSTSGEGADESDDEPDDDAVD